MTTEYNPIPTVLYTPDGRPYYAAAPNPSAALAVPQQPNAAPLPYYQPMPLPTPMPSGYSIARDPVVVRLLAGGIGLGAAGFGLGFLFQALAAATTAIGLLLGVLAVVWLLAHSGGGRGGSVHVNVNNRMTNRNR
jgi:hypothetical protein